MYFYNEQTNTIIVTQSSLQEGWSSKVDEYTNNQDQVHSAYIALKIINNRQSETTKLLYYMYNYVER